LIPFFIHYISSIIAVGGFHPFTIPSPSLPSPFPPLASSRYRNLLCWSFVAAHTPPARRASQCHPVRLPKVCRIHTSTTANLSLVPEVHHFLCDLLRVEVF
jgi:hypothetical protein